MTVLPELERDLLEAHARVVSRRGRYRHWWLVRRAGRAASGSAGSSARVRSWALAGVHALPIVLTVALAVAVGTGFIVLVHASHGGLTSAERLRRAQRYIAIAQVRTQRRDPGCVAAVPPISGSSGTPGHPLLSSVAALRGAGGAPAVLLGSFLSHLGPPVPTGVYRGFERLARTAILPAPGSAPALTVPGPVGLLQVHDRRARFYVMAAADVTGTAIAPARCNTEQTAALRGELPRIPRALRSPTLRLAAQMLAQRRAVARQAEGIVVMVLTPNGGGTLIDGYTATTAQLRQRGALSQAGFQWGKGMIFSGVVPDGVASVTLNFPAQMRSGKATPAFTVTTHPVRGVFEVWLPRTWVPQSFGGITTNQITWRAANGTVIKTIHPRS